MCASCVMYLVPTLGGNQEESHGCGVAKTTVKLGAGTYCPGWPQLSLRGGQERQSRNHSARGAPASPPRAGVWLLGGSLPSGALRGFQPFLPSKGLRFWGPFASRLCLQCQGPACFIKSPCALLPGAEFLLQGVLSFVSCLQMQQKVKVIMYFDLPVFLFCFGLNASLSPPLPPPSCCSCSFSPLSTALPWHFPTWLQPHHL